MGRRRIAIRPGIGSARDGNPPEPTSGLLREIGARSLLDIPCGDFRWLREVELGVPYIGADIVEELVRANTEMFGSPERSFICLDLTEMSCPKAM